MIAPLFMQQAKMPHTISSAGQQLATGGTLSHLPVIVWCPQPSPSQPVTQPVATRRTPSHSVATRHTRRTPSRPVATRHHMTVQLTSEFSLCKSPDSLDSPLSLDMGILLESRPDAHKDKLTKNTKRAPLQHTEPPEPRGLQNSCQNLIGTSELDRCLRFASMPSWSETDTTIQSIGTLLVRMGDFVI